MAKVARVTGRQWQGCFVAVAKVATGLLRGSDKSDKKEVATVARVAGGQTKAK